MPHYEIERRFLVENIPNEYQKVPKIQIQQGYIISGEGIGSNVRVRAKGDEYFLTVKTKAALKRAETEIKLSKEQFTPLWELTEGKRIQKSRREIQEGQHIIEIDVFEGALAGLAIAEIEFSSEEEAGKFTPPSWLGQEVTQVKGLSNSDLAREGIPKEYKHLLTNK